MIHIQDLNIRDPFVLVVKDDYYLYGTVGYEDRPCFKGFHSKDLVHFDEPQIIFTKEDSFWATMDYWAPEVHLYQGKYYLFATVKSEHHCRGTQIFVSDSPLGKFTPISEKPITPNDWECLDGTLFVDDGKPYVFFCREWLQVVDGEMYVMELSRDLATPVGEPVRLFKASDASWVRTLPNTSAYVTDGPFVYKEDGLYKMLWSSFGQNGYTLGICTSTSIFGPWMQQEQPLYEKDGGHAMLFEKDGEVMVTFHAPNDPRQAERARILPYQTLWNDSSTKKDRHFKFSFVNNK